MKSGLKDKLLTFRSATSAMNDFPGNTTKYFKWTLSNKIQISNDLMKFQMIHSDYIILNKIQRIHDFGKYFKVINFIVLHFYHNLIHS